MATKKTATKDWAEERRLKQLRDQVLIEKAILLVMHAMSRGSDDTMQGHRLEKIAMPMMRPLFVGAMLQQMGFYLQTVLMGYLLEPYLLKLITDEEMRENFPKDVTRSLIPSLLECSAIHGSKGGGIYYTPANGRVHAAYAIADLHAFDEKCLLRAMSRAMTLLEDLNKYVIEFRDCSEPIVENLRALLVEVARRQGTPSPH